MYRSTKEKKPIKCGAVPFFLSHVVIRPRLQKTSSSTFWVVLLSGHIIRAKTILPGALCLNMLRDYVKEKKNASNPTGLVEHPLTQQYKWGP